MDDKMFLKMIDEEITALTLEIKDCVDSLIAVKGLQIGTLQKLRARVIELQVESAPVYGQILGHGI